MLRLGAQMYTVREYTQDVKGLLESFARIKAAGYDAVQVSGIGAGIPVEVVAEGLKENGLVCGATHISFDDCKKDLDAVIAKHKAWGCEYVGVGSMPAEYRENAASIERFAKEFTKIGEELNKEGLKFIYHNHNFEFKKYDGKLGMDILFENAGNAFQFEIDTFWVQKGAADVCQWIDKMAGRMDVIHFKDMRLDENNEQIMSEIGQGNLNWDGIIRRCHVNDIQWAFVEQDNCNGRCPFESLKMSADFLHSKGVR